MLTDRVCLFAPGGCVVDAGIFRGQRGQQLTMQQNGVKVGDFAPGTPTGLVLRLLCDLHYLRLGTFSLYSET